MEIVTASPQNFVLTSAWPFLFGRTVNETWPFEFVFLFRSKPGPARWTFLPRTRLPWLLTVTRMTVERPRCTETRCGAGAQSPPPLLAPEGHTFFASCTS